MLHNYRLSIEFCDEVCLCHWNYNPPVKSVGGGIARIGPGGALGGFDYLKLRQLGPGTHDAVGFDERVPTISGNLPLGPDADVMGCRFAIFRWSCGVYSRGELASDLFSYATPDTIPRIIPLLPEDVRQLLRDFIAEGSEHYTENGVGVFHKLLGDDSALDKHDVDSIAYPSNNDSKSEKESKP